MPQGFAKVCSMKKHILVVVLALTLAGCGLSNPFSGGEQKYPTRESRRAGQQQDVYAENTSIFGEDGLTVLGGKKDNTGITVNAYLWRAALDTVSFMPLTSVDPFGGVILTDWYSAPESPNERYKLNVFILGSELRSDGIRVTMFKQSRGRGASWVDKKVDPASERQIEDAVLTRARQLRVSGLPEVK